MDLRILMAALVAAVALSGCTSESAGVDAPAGSEGDDLAAEAGRGNATVYHADNAGGMVNYMFLTAGPTEMTTVRAFEELVPMRPDSLGGVLVEATWSAPTQMAGGVVFELFQGQPGPDGEPLGIALADAGGALRAEVPADAWTTGSLVVRISSEGVAGGAGAQMSVEYHLYATVFEGEPDWSTSALG